MDLLLDTHAFLWFITGDKQLPDKIVKLIDDLDNNDFEVLPVDFSHAKALLKL